MKVVDKVYFFVTKVLLGRLIGLYMSCKKTYAYFRLFHKVVIWPKNTYVYETYGYNTIYISFKVPVPKELRITSFQNTLKVRMKNLTKTQLIH